MYMRKQKKIVVEVLPITPQEASAKRIESIEPEMIQAVNNMILMHLDGSGSCATVKQKDIVTEYFKIKGIEETERLRGDLYSRHQLDFEPIFKKAGWSIQYDKPGYNETYDANFTFTRKKKIVPNEWG